ncbi:hypothetical protein [Glutamicibacter sp. JC586]|uniref:hypothetical protein n=1 Tax=Glutamicibacter sp. JC586 TaxID=2590552 RepID=UPI00135C33B6|nr:hypothetical protein [Glutamicibacter sp. JC586]
MHQNTKYAYLTAGLVGSLTLTISLSSTLWVILLGCVLLAAGFSLISKLERFWGPATPKHYYYIVPMLIGPVVAGLVRNTEYALWVGAPAAVLCAVAVYFFIIKSPPFDQDADDEVERSFSEHRSAR